MNTKKIGHVWTDIENYKEQVQYIVDRLIELYPNNKEIYINNENKYIGSLNNLVQYKNSEDTYVISCNEDLEYLLKSANLNVIPVYTDHDESSLSSGKIAEIIALAKEKDVKVIFIDKNDDEKNAKIFAEETGAKIISLDSCLTGENNKDAYLETMEKNFEILRNELE